MADMKTIIEDAEEAVKMLGTIEEPTWECDFIRVSFEDVLELLKAQEPVKPKTHNGDGKSPTWWYVCGACGHDIDPKDKFCRECGRAVKW